MLVLDLERTTLANAQLEARKEAWLEAEENKKRRQKNRERSVKDLGNWEARGTVFEMGADFGNSYLRDVSCADPAGAV